MAAIDKIYGTKEQHSEFKKWCTENFSEALRYFYPWDYEDIPENEKHTITNFPVRIDKWLVENCPIDWVVNAIHDQYGALDFEVEPDDYYLITYRLNSLSDLSKKINLVLKEYYLTRNDIQVLVYFDGKGWRGDFYRIEYGLQKEWENQNVN